MSRHLDSLLHGPLAIVGVLLVVVAVQWALVSRGFTRFIVPAPDQVGQQFFTSLKAHNYSAAHAELSEDLRRQVTPDDLQAMLARLPSGIHEASGQNPQAQGQSATADVQIIWMDGGQQTVAVPFTRENGLWQVSSLAPLEALLRSP